MELLNKFQNIEKVHSKYFSILGEVEKEVAKICDFEVGITWCAGDGHLIINIETYSVATISCLIGKTEKNKLTAEEHKLYCI